MRSSSASRARSAPVAWRSPTTAPPASSRRPRWSGPATRTRPTGPGGRRCVPAPTTSIRYAHVFEAWFGVREQLPRTIARDRPREISPPLPMGEPGEAGGEVSPEVIHARRQRRRGAPPPGRRGAEARREGASGRDDRLAPAPVAASPRRASYAVAPWRDRHPAHAAHHAAADGRAGTGRAPATRDDVAQGGAARRRLGLDAALRRRDPAAGAPALDERARQGRGVHPRHSADPGHSRAAHLGRRAGAGACRASRSRTGPAALAWGRP